MWDKLKQIGRRPSGRRFDLAAAPMRETYLARIRAAGCELDTLTPEIAFREMLEWYSAVRIPGCDTAESGDMLLYQWGESYPDGASYLDITRQLMTSGGEDDSIFQLSLTLTFDVSAASLGIESDNRWCETPDGVADFRAFIERSAAFNAARNRRPKGVELNYGSV